jgi:hypothetical protein
LSDSTENEGKFKNKIGLTRTEGGGQVLQSYGVYFRQQQGVRGLNLDFTPFFGRMRKQHATPGFPMTWLTPMERMLNTGQYKGVDHKKKLNIHLIYLKNSSTAIVPRSR